MPSNGQTSIFIQIVQLHNRRHERHERHERHFGGICVAMVHIMIIFASGLMLYNFGKQVENRFNVLCYMYLFKTTTTKKW